MKTMPQIADLDLDLIPEDLKKKSYRKFLKATFFSTILSMLGYDLTHKLISKGKRFILFGGIWIIAVCFNGYNHLDRGLKESIILNGIDINGLVKKKDNNKQNNKH